jgi:hypothetical protein
MIRCINKIILPAFLVFLSLAGRSQDLFDYTNSKKFAGYLFNTRQFGLAANEYERILTINPNDTLVFANLIKTYRMASDCNYSFTRLENFQLTGFLTNPLVAREYLNLSLSCNPQPQHRNFQSALHSLDPTSQVFYTVGAYLNAGNRDSTFYYAQAHRDFLAQTYPSLLSGIDRMEDFRYKSPAFAAALSTIRPGAGKAYSKYWGDAFMSLLFVSTNAWLSYRGFSKKGVKSVNGWVFGSISVGFYFGNIFGSYKAAKNYNQIEYDKIYNEAKAALYSGF